MSQHLVLFPVEEPAAMLEMVVVADSVAAVSIPQEFRKCCRPRSIRVLSATPADVPCRIDAYIKDGFIFFTCHHPAGAVPSQVSFHIAGKARTSPPAWEHHSRQQFAQNRKAFSKALP